jgi:hypothetical protein
MFESSRNLAASVIAIDRRVMNDPTFVRRIQRPRQ